MTDSARIVVVGAGLAGASTAWRLASEGHEVVLLEKHEPANGFGSSHGSARIFRYAYPDELYAGLVVRARADWAELERESGETLIDPVGSVDQGSDRAPDHLARVLDRVGVEHELLTASDASERFGGIAFDGPVLWQPGAGVLDAERAVLAMVRLAVRAGAVLQTGWDVARVEKRGGAAGYQVASTDGRTLDAERVVVSAGGWLPELLGDISLTQGFLDVFPRLEVRQEQVYHFPYRDSGAAWPTHIDMSPAIQVYGLPGGRDAEGRGQKVAEFNGGRILRSASAQDGVVDPANRARVVDYVRARLPGLVPEPYAETTCLFTNTPTEDFVIDGVDGITVVSPCSGHGAKFAPLLGRIVADAVTGRPGVPDAFRVMTGAHRRDR